MTQNDDVIGLTFGLLFMMVSAGRRKARVFPEPVGDSTTTSSWTNILMPACSCNPMPIFFSFFLLSCFSIQPLTRVLSKPALRLSSRNCPKTAIGTICLFLRVFCFLKRLSVSLLSLSLPYDQGYWSTCIFGLW